MSTVEVALAAHVVAGSAGLLLGPLAIASERRPPLTSRTGAAFTWAATLTALTALVLIAVNNGDLAWLAPLAALTITLAWLARASVRYRWPGWPRLYAHGQGGAYIALVTALVVVLVDGPLELVAWLAPTAIGLPLIEWRVTGLRRFE